MPDPLVAGPPVVRVCFFCCTLTPASLGASGRVLNGFTMGSTSIDAVVSFAAGGVLMLIGVMIVLRGGLISRTLGFLTSIVAIMWAALIGRYIVLAWLCAYVVQVEGSRHALLGRLRRVLAGVTAGVRGPALLVSPLFSFFSWSACSGSSTRA